MSSNQNWPGRDFFIKLLLYFFTALLITIVLFVLMGWLVQGLSGVLPIGVNHLPVFLGFPLAALLSFAVIVIAGRYAVNYNYRPPFLYLLFCWLVIFFIVVLSIRLLWPLTLFSGTDNAGTDNENIVHINFMQLNDVYEISPLDSGRRGGLARVAELGKELKESNPNFLMVLAGDFLSPSAIGTVRQDGSSIMGKQMTDVLNSAGLGLVTFGNHEFDIEETQLEERISRSTFDWVSSNVKHAKGAAFSAFMKTTKDAATPVPLTKILTFGNGHGTKVKVGVFGITIGSTIKDWVRYEDYFVAASKAISELRDKCDFIVALTHLDLADDIRLAERFPEIKLIMGGHEHKNSFNKIGNTYIAKADANAKTVYLHSLNYNKKTRQLDISSQLLNITPSIKEDPATRKVVDNWNRFADSVWRHMNPPLLPCEVLATVKEPYDGTEEKIRSGPTNLTMLIARAMSAATKGKTVFSLYNSGSIRIDDYIKDRITQYDIIRTLPYGGKIRIATITGKNLLRLLDTSFNNINDGCFLQYDSALVRGKDQLWRVKIGGKEKLIQPNDRFDIAVNDYLIEGRQKKMEFLGDMQDSLNIRTPADSNLRQVIINYVRTTSSIDKSQVVPCY